MKIVLIGMMGSGKSTIAEILAQKLNYKLFECDEIFEKKFKISIKDYFKTFGEKNFRTEETKILKELIKNDDCIISTGGGAVLNKENRNLIFCDEIFTIYIKTDSKVIYERIKNDTSRPLLQVENPKLEIENIIAKREKYYLKATKIISNDDKIDKTIEEILKWIA